MRREGRLCYPVWGRFSPRGGRRGRSRALWPPAGATKHGMGGPIGAEQALESRRIPMSARSRRRGDGTGTRARRPRRGRRTHVLICGPARSASLRLMLISPAFLLLDNRHSIPSLLRMSINFEAFLPVSQSELFCNARIKVNPRTGDVLEAMVADRMIFRPSGWEARKGSQKPRKTASAAREVWETEEASCAALERWEAQEAAIKLRGARRAKRQLFETAVCNEFDLMFTLTLAPDKIDRYDYKAAVKRLGQWLDNRVRRRGLRYIGVPELHKDGAVHFHGFCNSDSCLLADSGHTDEEGHTVYHLTDWSLGFTTAVKLYGTYEAACNYISKYVTKQAAGGTIGGRYWYHGGDLKGPVVKLYRVDYHSQPGEEIELLGAGLKIKYLDAGKIRL